MLKFSTVKALTPHSIASSVTDYWLSKKRDRELALEFQAGDEAAFAAVYQRFNKPITHFIGMRIQDAELAQDLTQEVFLRAHRFRASYQSRYALSTWLWSIAKNVTHDHQRIGRLKTDDSFCAEEIPSRVPGAEALVERKLERRHLRRIFRKLTSQQRRVIWMRVIHQLSYAEIAKTLGLSLSSVKCLVHRSKVAMIQANQDASPAPA